MKGGGGEGDTLFPHPQICPQLTINFHIDRKIQEFYDQLLIRLMRFLQTRH